MSVNLTTRSLFKLYTGVSGTGNDALIDRLITDVCELVAKACGRTFESTTYKTWLDGNGASGMRLPEWPITKLYKVTSDVNNVLEIVFTGGEHADVAVDSTNVALHSLSSAGVDTETDVAVATYKIVSTLATQIETITGWTTTTQSGMGTQPTLFLKPLQGEDALTPSSVMLSVPDDGFDVRLVSETESMIERKNFFIFPSGHSNLFVWYTAGYTLPVDNAGGTALATTGNVPGGLTNMVNSIINDVYRTRKLASGMKSERIGDYSYSRGEIESTIKEHWSDLQYYSRIEI